MGRKNEGEMTFLEHLEELRWHLIKAIVAILVLSILAFIYHKFIFDFILLAPKDPNFITNRLLCKLGTMVNVPALCINTKPFTLISITMSGQFTAHIMVSIVVGIIAAFPYVFYQIWSFIVPAFHSNERRYANGAVLASSMLFVFGVLFGYFVLVPLTVHFFGSYQVSESVINQINLTSYMSNIATISLGCGIVFELPVVVYFLTKIGLISSGFLKRFRKHSLIVILIISAVITPPDIFSQLLISVPLYFLYEISILVARRIEKKNKTE